MVGVGIFKLKASALLEVLVAITILMTVVVMGTIIFVNVTKSSFTGEKIKAEILLTKEIYDTQKNKTFFDDEIKVGVITIKKEVEFYKGDKKLPVIYLKAVNGEERILAEKKQILLVDNEEN
jgi:hypothetical protein